MAFELAAIVGGTTASVLGALWSAGTAVTGTEKAKDVAASVCRRAAGRLPLPENHDLVIGIRTAHLAAIDRVARRHADLIETLPHGEVGSDESPFAASVRAWLDRRLSPLAPGRLDTAQVSQADIQQALDGMVHPASAGEFAEAAARNRRAAEARALAEIERDAGRPAPPLFARLFAGEAEPGWYDLVSLFVDDQLKSDERFRAVFLAAEFVDLKRLVAALDRRIAEALLRGVRRLARVEAKLDAVKQDTGVIVQMLERLTRRLGASDAERLALQAEVQRLRAAEELSAQTIAGFFRAIGEKGVEPANAPVFLERVAERHRALLAEAERRTNLPAAMEAERARAKDAIAAGDLDAAEAILRRLEAGLAEARREQQSAWQQSCRDEATVKSERAALAASRLRYREAAFLHAEAAALVDFDTDSAWRHTLASAGALYDQGNEFGDNDAFEQAIGRLGDALAIVRRESAPLDWAGTQNNLGIALGALGEREGNTARLGEAVGGFRAALEEWTRARAPLDWAMTQNNLGNALRALGAREAGTARLEEAVGAYRAALEEWTRERAPLQWAATQNNLGTVLKALGEREAGTARLEEAVGAFRAALRERTRARAPLQWAATQNNLGTALQALGAREAGTARLGEAVGAFRAALGERTRARAPLQWAATQNNLGTALQALGEREAGTARLEEAVGAYRAALEEWTRERAPLDWAATQNNLGAALQALGAREAGTARLEEAVGAFRAALKERTRARAPLQWAATQNNLGTALQTLGAREAGTARLEEAVGAFRAALEERTRERAPLDWAMAQNNLGVALQALGEREAGTARLEEAVGAFRAALEERTRERAPLAWAETMGNVALVEYARGEKTGDPARFRAALAACGAALEMFGHAGSAFHIEWATRLRASIVSRLSPRP